MNVTISLENSHEHYTNLDVIQGKVFLRVPHPTNISSIVAKLEGEARTRLLAPIHPNRPDKQRPVLEVHKFLYKTLTLWPTNVGPEELANNPKASYTINNGQYTYPFQFKMPLNTACQQTNSPLTNVSFTNAIPEFAKTPTQHLKTTLPPSLSGFPGEAEIRYFVKVTVNRPQFFKENPRSISNFTFLPIEPPRPEQADGEAFARRQHQFLEDGSSAAAGKKSYGSERQPSIGALPTGAVPPRIVIDARLPNPAILTCNQDVPLRLLMKNVSARTKNIYLQMLQVELIGYTKVRAHEVFRTESNSWTICSFSNMAIPLGSSTDPVDTEVPINPEYWSGKTIPNMIPPSFTTCNLSRFYELEVRVGVGYGSYQHGEDQLVILPLRLPVKVYSGIAPPMALLTASLSGASEKLSPGALTVPAAQQQAPHTPTTPTFGGFGSSNGGLAGQPMPAQAGAGAADAPPAFDEAPPSYEEAIGQDLPPINGYRGSYQPPPVPAGAPDFSDGKQR